MPLSALIAVKSMLRQNLKQRTTATELQWGVSVMQLNVTYMAVFILLPVLHHHLPGVRFADSLRDKDFICLLTLTANATAILISTLTWFWTSILFYL
jgi:hypothetical protein